MKQHARMVMTAVDSAIRGLEIGSDTTPTLTQLGAKHSQMGVKPFYFEVNMNTFLRSFHQQSDDF